MRYINLHLTFEHRRHSMASCGQTDTDSTMVTMETKHRKPLLLFQMSVSN